METVEEGVLDTVTSKRFSNAEKLSLYSEIKSDQKYATITRKPHVCIQAMLKKPAYFQNFS